MLCFSLTPQPDFPAAALCIPWWEIKHILNAVSPLVVTSLLNRMKTMDWGEKTVSSVSGCSNLLFHVNPEFLFV